MENTQLTVADMASIKNIIEAACTRGAFRAAEMSNIGEIYNKVSAFVDQAMSQLQQAQAPKQGDQNA
jgi:hypothetical protein